jgi:hypothetical protein
MTDFIINGDSVFKSDVTLSNQRFYQSKVDVKNITLSGATITISNCHTPRFENVRFSKTSLIILEGCYDPYFRNCEFIEDTQLAIYGINRQSNCIRIMDCRFENNTDIGLTCSENIRQCLIHATKFHAKKNHPNSKLCSFKNVKELFIKDCKFTSGESKKIGVGMSIDNCENVVIDSVFESLDIGIITDNIKEITLNAIQPKRRLCGTLIKEGQGL